jgi:hypothetical protein
VAIDPSDIKAIVDAIKKGIAEGSATAKTQAAGTAADPALAASRVQVLEKEIEALEKKKEIEGKLFKSAEDKAAQTRIEIQITQKRIDMILAEAHASGGLTEGMKAQIVTLEEHKTALEEDAEKQEKWAKKVRESKQAAEALVGSVNKLTQVYGTGSVSVMGYIKGLGKLWKALDSPQGAAKLLGGVLLGLMDTMFSFTLQVDQAAADLMKTTGASRQFSEAIFDSTQELSRYGVTAKELGEVTASLYNNFTDFTFATIDQRKHLANTGSLLKKLGVGAEDFAKGLQVSTKAFGLSADAAGQTAIELESLARTIGITPKQMATDFASAGKGIAKLGHDGVRAFKDLAIASKTTGLEIRKILAITDKFDTFEGAAEQAGKLNAALGGNFVNAMDLMMATDPVERFEMIRDSILDTGLTFDNMSYYQRKFYTDALGLGDVSDLALTLSGDMSRLEGATQKTTAEYTEMADRAKEVQSVQEEFKAIMMSLIPVFKPLIESLKQMAKDFEQNKDAIGGLIDFVELLASLFVLLLENWGKVALAFGAFKIIQFALGFKMLAGWVAALAAKFTTLSAVLARTGATAPVAAGGITSIGTAAGSAAPGLLVLSVVIVAIGAAIGMAAYGLSFLVKAFKGMGAEGILAAIAIGMVAAAFYFMIPALAGLITVGIPGAPVLWALAGAILAIGAAVAMAAFGLSVLVGAFAGLFDSIDLKKTAGLLAFFGGLSFLAPALALAAAAVGGMAYTLGLLAIAMIMFPISRLEKFSTFFGSIASVQASEFSKVAEQIRKINAEIESLPIKKAIALTSTMSAITVASVVGKAAAPGRMAAAAAPAGGATNERPYELTVNMKLDNKVVDKKILQVVGNKASESARG